ncbi:MAG: UDP-2,3-diacylglucosamine diphosphatase [Flavobacteriales bacterium]
MSKSIYFASDFHLGAPNKERSLIRERLIVKWLTEIEQDAAEIFLVGDVFDFWFEYKRAVPMGFTRLLGKLAELSDKGIKLHLFTGNHDMWIFNYVPQEIGAELYRAPIQIERQGRKLFIGHGDGLGPGDHGYKFIKKVFSNRVCQWLFARLHPNFGIWLADYFSRSSRAKTGDDDSIYLGEENEWLAIYSKEILQKEHYDYFIFGHRHLPLEIKLSDESTYFNLGDWLKHFTYGRLNEGDFKLLTYTKD